MLGMRPVAGRTGIHPTSGASMNRIVLRTECPVHTSGYEEQVGAYKVLSCTHIDMIFFELGEWSDTKTLPPYSVDGPCLPEADDNPDELIQYHQTIEQAELDYYSRIEEHRR